jgi:hypothetical protein
VLSGEDPEAMDDKNWYKMGLLGNPYAYSEMFNPQHMLEYTFAPVDENGDRTNQITYDSYNNFKSFAIKLVMRSTNKTIVPRIYSLRTIALPSGV